MHKSSLLPLVLLAGCVGHADVMMPHPLTGHAITAELAEVEKPLGYVESVHGLPAGSMTQKAKLTSLSESQACFDVLLHSLDADETNIRGLTTILKVQPSQDKVEQALVKSSRNGSKVYAGLVPHDEPAGVEECCASRDSNTNACNAWRTRQLYVSTMIPGPVTVYEGTANLCFAHEGVVTKQSQRIILDLHKVTMVGFMPNRVGVDFRWGFSGYSTAKPDKAAAKADRPAAASTTVSNDEETDAKLEAAMAQKEKEQADVEAKSKARRTRVAKARRPTAS